MLLDGTEDVLPTGLVIPARIDKGVEGFKTLSHAILQLNHGEQLLWRVGKRRIGWLKGDQELALPMELQILLHLSVQ